MALSVMSAVVQVTASLPGPGRLDLFAVRAAGSSTPLLFVEAYDADGLVAAGEVAVWELNQAIAALMADTIQARRLILRDDGRGHPGHLDVVCSEATVELVATASDDERRVVFTTTIQALSGDLNGLLRHYLALQRGAPPPEQRSVVLPDATRISRQAPARR